MGNDNWGKALLFMGGLALLGKLLEEASKNKDKVYRCPRCNYPVSKGSTNCPNCGQPLNWSGIL